ncbi:hypothetical protein [Mailhella massiliensis]|uniref:hypothetical protein n=1 Tax=Mailhella massiliensis TaxID=1903261 RepID=UPI0023F02033|nr:hypothetical protein [Mailhella massiliensis]
MKKNNNLAGETIDSHLLANLGAIKEPVGKTILKLAPRWEAFMRSLACSSHLTLRKFLDSLADIADAAHKEGRLVTFSPSEEGLRKSYAISDRAKETFSRIARKQRITRDTVIHSTLFYISQELQKSILNAQQKIAYAQELEQMRCELCNVYERFEEARKRLSACGDPDFAECNTALSHIEQIYELDLNSFIKKKEKELQKEDLSEDHSDEPSHTQETKNKR